MNKSYSKSINNNLVNGVEITRNALLLQQTYIDQYENEKEFKMDQHEIEDYEPINNTLVISYNPLQSSIITDNLSKDITHPIHIYRSAYSELLDNFVNRYQLESIYNCWMNKFKFPETMDILCNKRHKVKPKVNIIDSLVQLIRYNKKYELLMVPSSIKLKQSFLDNQCIKISPDPEDIANYRVTFIYKGLIYKHGTKNKHKDPNQLYLQLKKMEHEKKQKNKENIQNDKKESIINKIDGKKDRVTKINHKEEIDPFPLDAIKFLIRVVKQNIIEDALDFMDPDYNYDDITKNNNTTTTKEKKQQKTRRSTTTASTTTTQQQQQRQRPQRLRNCIKRNNKDIMLRWIKIGCGSCFVHEFVKTYEVEQPADNDYDIKFPQLLKQAMFKYYIDCKIPYDLHLYHDDHDDDEDEHKYDADNKSHDILCNLCGKYMIEPINVNQLINFIPMKSDENNKKQTQKQKKDKIIECGDNHKYCKLCIIGWQSLVTNPEFGKMNIKKVAENQADDQVFEQSVVNLEKEIIAKFNGDVLEASKHIQTICLPYRCPKYLSCLSGKLCHGLNSKLSNKDIEKIVANTKDINLLEENISLPITIYEQINNENINRFERLDLMNTYQYNREATYLLENNWDDVHLTFQQQIEKDPTLEFRAAGYGK